MIAEDGNDVNILANTLKIMSEPPYSFNGINTSSSLRVSAILDKLSLTHLTISDLTIALDMGVNIFDAGRENHQKYHFIFESLGKLYIENEEGYEKTRAFIASGQDNNLAAHLISTIPEMSILLDDAPSHVKRRVLENELGM